MNKHIPSRNNGVDPLTPQEAEFTDVMFAAPYQINPVDGTVCVEGSDIVLDMADYRGHDYGDS